MKKLKCSTIVYMISSLSIFIINLKRCLKGDGQFTDPNMALQHNFITKAASSRIDRPSDLDSDWI
jgi:hypothetical protein